ncbi:MAG: SprT-like domain-containing protein [Gemmatimonadaceae bacterium]
MLRSLKEKLRLERLRWLWTQCDLFDAQDARDAPAASSTPTTSRPRVASPTRPTNGPGRSPPKENSRRSERTHRDDVAFVELLATAHGEYNTALFGGDLKDVHIRISRRMKNRLGHYMAAGNGLSAEIAISRKHIERDPWDDVLHTFVHEMVHQWQAENGHALDHGRSFRRKAREVGISARATRSAARSSQPRLAARAMHRTEP